MPVAVDSVFVALLIALAPEPDAVAGAEHVAGLQAEPQQQQPDKPKAVPQRDPELCRYFVDPEARRKCVIRTDRANQAASGAAEPSFPEGTFWLTPDEPPMPSRLPPNQQR